VHKTFGRNLLSRLSSEKRPEYGSYLHNRWIYKSDQAGFGRFYELTFLVKVDSRIRISISKTFGPAVGIQAVDSSGETTKIINSMRYGLESKVFTHNKSTIEYLTSSLNLGTVNFNDVPLVNNNLLPETGR
jgi:acyl-CoA reductase-like NAD-dependent aldehyde dehydrogenase